MNLSNPEKRILEELIRGTEIKDIPRKAFMSLGNVKRIIRALKDRFECTTNEQLMYFIGKNDLLIKSSQTATDETAKRA